MRENIISLINEITTVDSYEEFAARYSDGIHKTIEKDDKYIAHLGCDRRLFNLPTGEIKAGFLLDNVVTEGKRNEGIFTNLFREFENENSNLSILYAFPLQYELLNLVDKQDFKIVGEVRVYAKVLDASGVMRGFSALSKIANFINNIKEKSRKTDDISNIEVREAPEIQNVSAIYERIDFKDKWFTKRTEDFISKRVNLHGDQKFLLASAEGRDKGYLIYKLINRSGINYFMVMDVLYESKRVFEALLTRLVEIAKEKKVTLVALWYNGVYSEELKRLGFSFAKSTIPFVAKSSLDIDLKNIDNWYLQPIEGEIY